MTIQSPPPTFQAKWNETNIHLKDTEDSTAQKIRRFIWNVLSILLFPIGLARMVGWAVKFIAKHIVLQSRWIYPQEVCLQAKKIFEISSRDLNQFTVETHTIASPDNVRLKALHFRHKQTNQNTPTVIIFQSTGSISYFGTYRWLIEESIKRGSVCNFVVFDYRGVDSSEGDPQATTSLLIDGETAFQFVKDHLHIRPEQIHWYGRSLGGGVGTYVKSLHPECTGPLVNERSFDSLKSMASYQIPSLLRPLLFWFPWAVKKQGWDLRAPLEKLTGKAMIVYHPDDPTIPYGASAHKAAVKSKLSLQSIKLYQTPEQVAKAEADLREVHHHCEHLSNYNASEGLTADQAIADFILPPPQTARERSA